MISAAPARTPRIAVAAGDERSAPRQHAREDGEAAEERGRLARQPALLQAVHGTDPAAPNRATTGVSAVAANAGPRRSRGGRCPSSRPQRIAGGQRHPRPRGEAAGVEACTHVNDLRVLGPRAGGQVRRDRRSGFLTCPSRDAALRPAPAPLAGAFLALGDQPVRGGGPAARIPPRWPAPSSWRSTLAAPLTTAGARPDRDRSPRRRHAAGQDLDHRGRRGRRRTGG